MMNHTAWVIPAFFSFLYIEYAVIRRKGIATVSFENSLSNISVGIAERLLNLFITGSFYGLYVYIYDHYALTEIPANVFTYVILLMATDFVWYWYHRLGHEVNVMWGAHVVHHQSEEFNYSVSARITTLQALIRNAFWIVLPFIGFAPSMVMVILVVHGTYSFFTHTETIGKLGWLENFLITPSHHRVHHASNDKYLNKNYGDIFIFWDKLFGTFEPEQEKPVYGLTHPLKSHSFLWQHFHYYAELWSACRAAKNPVAIFKILFGKPESLDSSHRLKLESVILKRASKENKSVTFRAYLVVQTIIAILVLFCFALFIDYQTTSEKFFITLLILVTLINCGALLEQRRWVYYLEIIRLAILLLFLSWEFETTAFALAIIPMTLVLSYSQTLEDWYGNHLLRRATS